jgi:hypothetical protein
MKVIRHQAVREHDDAVTIMNVRDAAAELDTIVVVEEDRSPASGAVHDVVESLGGIDSW